MPQHKVSACYKEAAGSLPYPTNASIRAAVSRSA